MEIKLKQTDVPEKKSRKRRLRKKLHVNEFAVYLLEINMIASDVALNDDGSDDLERLFDIVESLACTLGFASIGRSKKNRVELKDSDCKLVIEFGADVNYKDLYSKAEKALQESFKNVLILNASKDDAYWSTE